MPKGRVVHYVFSIPHAKLLSKQYFKQIIKDKKQKNSPKRAVFSKFKVILKT